MTLAGFAWYVALILVAAATVLYFLLCDKNWLAEREAKHNALSDPADWDKPIPHDSNVRRMQRVPNGK